MPIPKSSVFFFPNIVAMSPGVLVDGGGFVLVITVDQNGKIHVKKVPVPPGPDGWGILPAAVSVLSASDGVRGLEALRAEALKVVEQKLGGFAATAGV